MLPCIINIYFLYSYYIKLFFENQLFYIIFVNNFLTLGDEIIAYNQKDLNKYVTNKYQELNLKDKEYAKYINFMNDDIIKAQYLIAATVSIFTNSIKDKNILEIEDINPYIEKSKEIANKFIESLL